MPAKYDVYDTPVSSDGLEKNMHVRIITDGTVKTDDLAKLIEYSSSVTKGEVDSVLSSLSHYISEMLMDGRRVHIDGLGYFQMTAKCPPAKSPKDVRGDMVKFKSVSFRPEQSLKAKLKTTQFIRADKRNMHSERFTDSEIDRLLEDYFRDNLFITRKKFAMICGLTDSTAKNRIRKLVEEGKLIKQGAWNAPFYIQKTETIPE